MIKSLAKKNRWRVRNLHDGFPVPPMTRKRGSARSKGYKDDESRHDAIVCSFGYVDNDGWTIIARSGRHLGELLKKLAKIGVSVRQEGDTEACGVSPGGLEAVARVLRPYKAF